MWVIFAISASLCWAMCYIIDKYVLAKWVRSPLVPMVMLGIIGLIASIVIFSVYGFSPLPKLYIFFILGTGVIWAFQNVFYFKALKIGEVSRVVPLFHLSPLFILVFAGIFLGEVFTPLKYLGIFLLIAGAILISAKSFTRISFDKAFWWMMLSVVGLSAYYILIKYLLNFTDYWTIFAWMRIGATIGLIPIFYLYMPELVNTVRRHGKKVIVVMSTTEILNLVAVLFITIAASIGYITLVNALSSVEPFFVLLFIIILSRFFPSILKEEISKSIIFQKIAAIVLMFVGAILIT